MKKELNYEVQISIYILIAIIVSAIAVYFLLDTPKSIDEPEKYCYNGECFSSQNSLENYKQYLLEEVK